MANRAKGRRTYQDSSDDDVEILGSTQRSGAPKISQSTASSRPDKRDLSASFARSHRYNYKYNSDAEGGDEDFVVDPPADNNDEYLSDV